jgi:fibronectin type 3 domain-containing protein
MNRKFLPLVLLISISMLIFNCEESEEDDVTAPDAPTNLMADPNLSIDGRVSISWDASSDNDVALYNVYRNANGGSFTEITEVTGTSYFETGLDYDTEYGYRVSAEDENGNESPMSDTKYITPYNQLSPAVPSGLSAVAHNIVADFELNVELTWSANTESDFSHYKIYRSDSSPSFQANENSFVDSTNALYYLDENVVAGNTYHYKIVAFDLGGFDSDPTIVVSDTPLEVPNLLRPTNSEENVSANPTFEWQNVNSAEKYKIIVRTSSLSGDIWESEITATSSTTMSITYPSNATTLEANTRYFWFISGYSQNIEDVNVYSETFSFRTQ